MQRHSLPSLETARSLANDPSGGGNGGKFPGNYSVSYLSFVYGRSLWAELNGGENFLLWKANMLPLFSITYAQYKKKMTIFTKISLKNKIDPPPLGPHLPPTFGTHLPHD